MMTLKKYSLWILSWLVSLVLAFILGHDLALELLARDIEAGRQTIFGRVSHVACDIQNREYTRHCTFHQQ